MGFEDKMAMRNCGYCGLQRAQMRVVTRDHMSQSSNSFGGQNLWHSILECPDCGRLTIVQHLPEDVEKYLTRARRVLNAGVPDSAAVQLRRALEAAAAHFGVKEGVLDKRIKMLITQGLVTKQFGDALHHVRDVGNQGAHAGDEDVDSPTAEQAFGFTVQLLRNLFEVPGELQRIEQQKAEFLDGNE
jgi:hypothetical protein